MIWEALPELIYQMNAIGKRIMGIARTNAAMNSHCIAYIFLWLRLYSIHKPFMY
jgi:hypothetical protein